MNITIAVVFTGELETTPKTVAKHSEELISQDVLNQFAEQYY